MQAAPRAESGSLRTLLIFALLILVWGSTWLVIKIGLAYYPPFFSLAVRFLIAGPALMLIIRIQGEKVPWGLEHQPFFFSLAVLSFSISYGVVYWAEQYVTSGLTAVIFSLMPLFTGVVAHRWIVSERLTHARVIGLFFGLAGMLIVNAGDLAQLHPRAPLAALLLILSPLVTAVASVMSKRRVHEFPALSFAAIPMFYAGVIHVGVWWVVERDIPLGWSLPGIAAIAYLTVMGSMITFSGYYWLLRRMEVSRVNLIAYLVPLVALAFGFFFGAERLTPHIIAGAAMVLAGVAMANRQTRPG